MDEHGVYMVFLMVVFGILYGFYMIFMDFLMSGSKQFMDLIDEFYGWRFNRDTRHS